MSYRGETGPHPATFARVKTAGVSDGASAVTGALGLAHDLTVRVGRVTDELRTRCVDAVVLTEAHRGTSDPYNRAVRRARDAASRARSVGNGICHSPLHGRTRNVRHNWRFVPNPRREITRDGQNFKTYDAANLAVTERLMSGQGRSDVAI